MYAYTAASLPFLFALTDNSTAPGRASIIVLLLSIGRNHLDGLHGRRGDDA